MWRKREIGEMMIKDEALRLALEALEDLGNHDRVCPQWPTYAEPENYPKCNCGYDQAITAIKAALEAKDEPWEKFCDSHCVWTNHHPDCKLAKDELMVFNTLASLKHKKTVGPIESAMSNTAPPQRTWVGLTDEEVQTLRYKIDSTAHWTYDEFARAIEIKLKELNT